MRNKTKKTYTAEEQARIDSVITVVGREPKPTAPTAEIVETVEQPTEETTAVVETAETVEQAPAPTAETTAVVEPIKTFEQQQEEFEKLRVYIKEKEAKLKHLETIESNVLGLESLQKENAEFEEFADIFDEDAEESENNFSLTLHGVRQGHRRATHFNITSPAIIEEYLDLLINNLRLRAENLRTEIAKA